MASSASAASGVLAATRRSIDALLGDVGGLLADLTSQEHSTGASDDEENEEARRVIDVELQRFWQGYYELKRRHEENALSVAVLALTKSGKSTLLNALMGLEVLPMNNVPETARICRMTHDPSAREPLLRDAAGGKTLARGEAAIRARLQQLNSAARTSSGPLLPQPSGGLTMMTTDLVADGAGGSGSSGGVSGTVGGGGAAGSAASVLHISAPLVALEGYGPEFGRVTLLDTPGPNEAGEEQLKHQVERLLEGVDCVLYLLDYTKLKTAEEEGLFRRLRAINPQLVARLSSRLFFVINKVDASETSEGLDPDEVRNYVADLVTRQLGGADAPTGAAAHPPPTPPPAAAGAQLATGSSGSLSSAASLGTPTRASSASGGATAAAPGSPASGGPTAATAAAPFRLHPDQVLLLSARNALLARLVLGGRASPEALKRFQRLAFGAFGGGGFGGFGVRGGAAAGPSNEQVRAAAGCLLEGSGILDLEGRVLTFLAAHAGSVKLLATADDLTRLLAQVRNVALACRSCLHRNVAALQEQVEGLRGELAEASVAFEEVRARTDAVQAEVVAEIKAHLNTLRRRLFTHIVQTLDTDARAPPSQPPHTAPSPGTPPTSRWHRVREKFLSMFTASCSALPPQPAGSGPSLVPEARSRSREELQALLLDLHDDLMGQIHSEVYDFWGVLEACAASRHSELLSALNGHLAALSRRVEGAVSEALGVQLAAADIRLRPPSAEQLHSDVQELIEKGIRESTEKHIRVGARTTTERVFRQPQGPPSLCRWGGYWVDVPRTRTVVETYTATVYSLRPDEIANHFIGLVDGAVTASERALASYVEALVERQLAAAKERIRDYGDRYLSVMTAALAASSRGAECRSSALAAVEGYLARLDDLVTRAQAAQRDAEGAVPGGAAGLMDEVEVYEDDLEIDSDGGSGEYGQELPQQKQGEELQEQEPAGAVEEAQQQQQGEEQQGEEQAAVAVQQAPDEVGGGADEEAGCVPAVPAAGVEDAPAAPQAAATPSSSSSVSSIPDIDDAAEGEVEVALPAAEFAQPLAQDVASGESGVAAYTLDSIPSHDAAASLQMGAGAGNAPGAQVIPSLQRLAGDAVQASGWEQHEAPAQQPQQRELVAGPGGVPDAALPPPSPVLAVGEVDSGTSLGAGAVVSGSSACASSSYSTMPFDYSRAFLEAMSSSEMLTAPGAARLDEPLTMIPLTVDEDSGIGGCGAAVKAASCGTDTPHSGASEDWHLVGEEALEENEASEAAAGSK
ncbi:hypothetical protein PLESTB_000863800 [Pleodorina starrii]|uniref:Dynamin N-terminal domain-containing protein n=1 Tax=Pleodorina starrii TaxID=330485 RepID=A0A9W6BLS8_9CHLO|nr:hypothetical protein PLESTM_001430200 [Pleodorina starrii]GLC54439.1 hypothetical protein PLESTB_000863800 [Pleodorina starrii]GLC72094.1 hypothetical protein PLESTF_001203200 [Pleodorina starrii]